MKKEKKSWNFCKILCIKTIETYGVSSKKYTANENSGARKTEQTRLMLLSNCTVCSKKKSTFIKNKEINTISND